jgi:hypothetical protein
MNVACGQKNTFHFNFFEDECDARMKIVVSF